MNCFSSNTSGAITGYIWTHLLFTMVDMVRMNAPSVSYNYTPLWTAPEVTSSADARMCSQSCLYWISHSLHVLYERDVVANHIQFSLRAAP